VADANGTTVPLSASRLQGGLQSAVDAGEPGFSSFPTRSAGVGYAYPNGDTVRIMQPTRYAGLRASFENSSGNAINPFSGRPPQPPKGFTGNSKDYVRSRSHIELDD